MITKKTRKFLVVEKPADWFSALIESNPEATEQQIDLMWSETLHERLFDYQRKHKLSDVTIKDIEQEVLKIYLNK